MFPTSDIQDRIGRLRSQINDLRYRYHVANDPGVTDGMYDSLMHELRQWEERYPELITPDSPTQRVAGKPLEGFDKVVHPVPQWSFNDAFDDRDVRAWEERIIKILEKELGFRPYDMTYVCELKIDGLHMVLTYEQGLLITAATRGDGKVGENVTQNIRTIQSVPLRLHESVSLVVEGEVWLGRDTLLEINKERHERNEPLFANPRNAAAGTIRQLDPSIVARRKLALTAYDISLFDTSSGTVDISTQTKELHVLKHLGFKTDPHSQPCKNLEEVFAFYQEWASKKNSQPFWIDGVVIKVNEKRYQEILGYTGKAPRFTLAYKFPAEQGTTKIREIYMQVGRTGALTPVALMEPVKLAGTTVTHATLHNFDEINRLDVRIGDTVVVEKAGDIIPKVVRVLEKMRTGDERVPVYPDSCPVCGARVENRSSGSEVSVALYCSNRRCYAQELERMAHFVGKSAFNIDGCGEKIIEQLLNAGLIKDAADLFTLTKGDLLPLDRFGEKSADNLVRSIAAARTVTLARCIVALGIPHVGEETAAELAKHFASLQAISDASTEELSALYGVGEKVAHAVHDYFSEPLNRAFIQKLFDNGVIITASDAAVERLSDRLAGSTFVLTGTLARMTRLEAQQAIKQRGGEVSDTVTKKTSYVVVGENPGSKLHKAQQLGIEILDEATFEKILSTP